MSNDSTQTQQTDYTGQDAPIQPATPYVGAQSSVTVPSAESLVGEKVIAPLHDIDVNEPVPELAEQASGGEKEEGEEAMPAVAPTIENKEDEVVSTPTEVPEPTGGSDGSEKKAMDEYIDALIVAKQLDALDAETISEIKSELKAKLIEYTNLAVFNAFPDDKLDELEKAIAERGREGASEVFRSSGVDYDKVVSDALMEFGKLYLGEAEKDDGTAAE